jgi:hypothetical protein
MSRENYHTIRYGNKDGEIKFGHIDDRNNLFSFLARSGAHSKHYIAFSSTGEPHLKYGTVCRSPGSFQIKAGDNVPSGLPGIYFESVSGDIVIKANGRVRIEGENINLKATGGDGKNGVIDLSANEKIILDSQIISISSKVSTKIFSENTLNVVGNGILNIYGGLIDAADGATSRKGSKSATGTPYSNEVRQ